MDLSPDRAAGGGYFLNLGGGGCVVDPGYGFLENFYALKHTLKDIDCIVVTHFHDDHYADFLALLSLLYHREEGAGIRLFLDRTTYQMFHPIIDFSTCKRARGRRLRKQGTGYIQEATIPSRHDRKPIPLTDGVVLRPFPTRQRSLGSTQV